MQEKYKENDRLCLAHAICWYLRINKRDLARILDISAQSFREQPETPTPIDRMLKSIAITLLNKDLIIGVENKIHGVFKDEKVIAIALLNNKIDIRSKENIQKFERILAQFEEMRG